MTQVLKCFLQNVATKSIEWTTELMKTCLFLHMCWIHWKHNIIGRGFLLLLYGLDAFWGLRQILTILIPYYAGNQRIMTVIMHGERAIISYELLTYPCVFEGMRSNNLFDTRISKPQQTSQTFLYNSCETVIMINACWLKIMIYCPPLDKLTTSQNESISSKQD